MAISSRSFCLSNLWENRPQLMVMTACKHFAARPIQLTQQPQSHKCCDVSHVCALCPSIHFHPAVWFRRDHRRGFNDSIVIKAICRWSFFSETFLVDVSGDVMNHDHTFSFRSGFHSSYRFPVPVLRILQFSLVWWLSHTNLDFERYYNGSAKLTFG